MAPAMNLTQADIYKALAANPFGKGPNTAQTWKDVNPALPAIKIRVLGPPPTSGTRDSLADLYLTKGCDTDPAMKALAKSNEDKHKDICTKVREDGAYVEAGENDNLLVQKVSADPGTLGVLGYSYLEENADKVRAGEDRRHCADRRRPSPTSPILARASSTFTSRASTCTAKPKIRDFVAQYAKMWSKGGPLERRGLVPFGGADATAATAQATALKPLDPSDTEVSRSGGRNEPWPRARRRPARRARGGLARLLLAPAGCALRRGSIRCRSITALMRRCGRRSRRC